MCDSYEEGAWFFTRKIGIGWGLATCWRGFAVQVGYVLLLIGGLFTVLPATSVSIYLAYAGVLTVLFLLICAVKGESFGSRLGETFVTYRDMDPRIYLAYHVFLGPALLAIALWLYFLPPQFKADPRYGLNGYSSAASYQSTEAWDEAQRFSARVMLAAAFITILFDGVSIGVMKPKMSLLTSLAVMALGLSAIVPITEAHLKSHFDRHGQKFVQPTSAR
ncbi:MAG: SdpI family protein [Candidatus Hydrogenedentes bacterium]|nr:SdpI family protein [Candidatus Hydrogenedentota bacterium]